MPTRVTRAQARSLQASLVTKRSKRAAAPLERPTQQAVVAWMRRVLPAGSVVQCIPNEKAPKSKNPMARARFHKMREKDGHNWGFPDLVAILPMGRGILVEMKRPHEGIVSDRQDGMHTRLRSLGWTVFVADSIESARYELRAAGVKLAESAMEPAYPAVVRVEKSRRMVDDEVSL